MRQFEKTIRRWASPRAKPIGALGWRTMGLALGLFLPLAAAGCAASFRPFPLVEPMWIDPDRQLHASPPEAYYSPWAWDAADQTLFRPFAELWAVDPGGEAVNVNALDEVPSSSWFTSRSAERWLTSAEVARGSCVTPPLDTRGRWTVTGAKPNGANPGFIIEADDGRRYLLKFDGVLQGPRATTADVVVSKIYHAAGFFTPCNRVVFFDRSILTIGEAARAENAEGDKVPMTLQHLDAIFSKALRLPDGRYRASASLFLEGTPLGPFTYQGTRADDPNDVVAHEDRRELRGSRLLAAWTNHFDSREQNSLTTWIAVGGSKGYVRHHLIDFGDCFGSIWEPPMLGRRIGHSSYLDLEHITEDLLTFGLVRRPWDEARFGPSGRVLGYYDVKRFDPVSWRPGFPNPAMSRMTERDGAWMARIIARFTDAHLRALVATAELGDATLERELQRLLRGRRDRVLVRYFRRLSPLTEPHLEGARGRPALCLRDAAVESGLVARGTRQLRTRAWRTLALEPVGGATRTWLDGARACTELPSVPGATRAEPGYLVVDLQATSPSDEPGPARVHLYHLGGDEYRVVGLERPPTDEPRAGPAPW